MKAEAVPVSQHSGSVLALRCGAFSKNRKIGRADGRVSWPPPRFLGAWKLLPICGPSLTGSVDSFVDTFPSNVVMWLTMRSGGSADGDQSNRNGW